MRGGGATKPTANKPPVRDSREQHGKQNSFSKMRDRAKKVCWGRGELRLQRRCYGGGNASVGEVGRERDIS